MQKSVGKNIKNRTESNPYVITDEGMIQVFDRILHRNSVLDVRKNYYQFRTSNIYYPSFGFVEEEIFEENHQILSNQPGMFDVNSMARFFHELDGYKSRRACGRNGYLERLRKKLDLPMGMDVSKYVQGVAKEWNDYLADERALNKKGQEVADKLQDLYIALDPSNGLSDLRADVREFNTRHPSSRGEVLMEFGNRFINQMYISQLQNDKYSGYTQDMIRHTLELFNPFSFSEPLPSINLDFMDKDDK